jgi:ubiquinone/menaquinone biosynthesis C-methylase UbiE
MNTIDHSSLKSQRMTITPEQLRLLRCPVSYQSLVIERNCLHSQTGDQSYDLTEGGIPKLVRNASSDAIVQEKHYDAVAHQYVRNLGFPHTREYMAYLDRMMIENAGENSLGTVAEICCGQGDAISLFGSRIQNYVGVDISTEMLHEARTRYPGHEYLFVQGDATNLPLTNATFDTIVMLGGIHHVNERHALFSEIQRILKPGGRFLWREPVDDFIVWRATRKVIYRISPSLDHLTERPLIRAETVAQLNDAGLSLRRWRTHGLIGFCFLMNSDILVFNRLFRFIPKIETVTRAMANFDESILRLPGCGSLGLIVVGEAIKA